MGQGAYIFGCEGPVLSPDEAAFFAESDPWGFILVRQECRKPGSDSRVDGCPARCGGPRRPGVHRPRGRRVARLRPPHWRDWPAPLDHVAGLGDEAAETLLWLRYRLICHELREVGIDGNCAPLADVAGEETHPFLFNRCYGQTAASVSARSRAVAEAHREGGVLPVLKHIPGHGRGTVDSHLGLPTVTADRAALDRDFAPFVALSDLPLAMTAHVTYTAIDDLPATQSPAAIRLIREEIGFDGLLMTDDISMEALGGGIDERSDLSLKAGCDVVLHCNGKRPEMEAVAAFGQMSAQAQARADRAIAARTLPEPFDVAAAEAHLARLERGRSDA